MVKELKIEELKNVDDFCINFVEQFNEKLNILDTYWEQDGEYYNYKRKEIHKLRKEATKEISDGKLISSEYPQYYTYLYIKYGIVMPPESQLPDYFLYEIFEELYENGMEALNELFSSKKNIDTTKEFIINHEEMFAPLVEGACYLRDFRSDDNIMDIMSLINSGIKISTDEIEKVIDEYDYYDFYRFKDGRILLKEYLLYRDRDIYIESQIEDESNPPEKRRYKFYAKHLAAVQNSILTSALGVENKMRLIESNNGYNMIVIHEDDYPFSTLYKVF